ncbi:MAG TPA: DUF362 domain-containing protein, partial [Anaerolineae bacterium]
MLSRREFIRRSTLIAMGSALAACSPKNAPPAAPPSPFSPVPSAVPPFATATRPVIASPAAMTATPIPPAAGEPYIVVARGANPAAITRAAVDALGGIGKFVKPGNDVILKPNLCNASNTFEYATTTNPEVVAELVRLCLGAGAGRVRVMDQPFSGTAAQAYKVSGMRDAVERAGGQMEIMSSSKYV